LKRISSRDNPDYKALLALAEDPRARRRAAETLLDGEHLIEDALRNGLMPARLIVLEGASGRHAWLDRLPAIERLELTEPLFRKLSPVHAPTGVMAVLGIPAMARTDAAQADAGRFVLLLEGVQDPGNLGAILRSAAATAVDTVILSPGCAEAWSPKALRGGQGGQFRLRIQEGVDLEDWLAGWSGRAFAAVPGAARSLYDLDLGGAVALAFGNEGQGLSPALQARCETFAIPMAAGVESLNVAASATLCLYERFRQGLK